MQGPGCASCFLFPSLLGHPDPKASSLLSLDMAAQKFSASAEPKPRSSLTSRDPVTCSSPSSSLPLHPQQLPSAKQQGLRCSAAWVPDPPSAEQRWRTLLLPEELFPIGIGAAWPYGATPQNATRLGFARMPEALFDFQARRLDKG